ncbi:MAG: DUF1579 domain-containing protein [Bacteroidota bacterium]
MKKINYIICLVALAGICFNATAQNKDAPANAAPGKDAQEKEVRAKQSQESQKQDEQMKAWMAYMTPGAMQEMLAKSNGDWNEEVTMWMSPGAPPMKSTAMATNSMILGNRYLQSKSIGSFNGMPFEGTGITAYDNAKKVFMSTWIDNMGTGIMYSEGKYDEKTKTVNYTGDMVDPMSGKSEKFRQTFKMTDENNQVMEMYSTQNGKEFKTMEIKFMRKM